MVYITPKSISTEPWGTIEIILLPKIDLKNVFQEAHLLEHAISQDVENAIEKLLDYPDKDPFGQDIPGVLNKEKSNIIPLSETTKNNSYTISKIPPENPEFVDFLHKNKILPGNEIIIQELSGTRGIINIIANNNSVDLALNVARTIWVK